MFDLGWTELLLIGVVALIVVGPKDLPILFHKLGKMTNKARSMAREFTRALEDAARESGVDDVAKDLRNVGRASTFTSTGLKEAVARFDAEELAKEPEPEPAKETPEKAKAAKSAKAPAARKAPVKAAAKASSAKTTKARTTKAAGAKTAKTATKSAASKPAAAKAKATGTKTTKPAAKKPASTRKTKSATASPDETKT